MTTANEPLPYAYSTGDAFAIFAKFNGRNYFAWRQKMITQLRALGQWEVVNGTLRAPVPAVPNNPTPDEARQIEVWELRSARAYAEIALRLEDDYGGAILAISDPHVAWSTLERSYGSQQFGIQPVINAKLTLAKWDGVSPITAHRDYMKALRTRLAGAGLAITNLQFYNHFVNSLPADYDMIIAIHDPAPLYSVDTLCECEHFRAIELWRELRTSKDGGATDDSIALPAKHKGSRGVEEPSAGKREGRGGRPSGRSWRQKGTCWGCGKAWFRGHDCPSRRGGRGPRNPNQQNVDREEHLQASCC
jgi:hypothetical protein